MNKPRVIRDDTGQPTFAVIPWREFERLVGADAETMLSDERALRPRHSGRRRAVPRRGGGLLTHAPSTYKIPTCSDVPADFQVEPFEPGRNREPTIHRSKAVGEPPLMHALSVFSAVTHALASLAPDACRRWTPRPRRRRSCGRRTRCGAAALVPDEVRVGASCSGKPPCRSG